MTDEQQKTNISPEGAEELYEIYTKMEYADTLEQAKELIDQFIRRKRELEEMEMAGENLVHDLTRERQRQQVSQEELAIRLATKQPNLARMERGHRDPKISTVQKYAEALGKRIRWTIEDL